YTAFLVPAFERGRQAGLGEKVEEPDWRTPAWKEGDVSIHLPVYYQWRFQTGVTGDFEYLVRRIKPHVIPKEVGKRDMDVSDPGSGLPAAASNALGVEGALWALDTESTPWDHAERDTWTASLSGLLNRPAQLLEIGR